MPFTLTNPFGAVATGTIGTASPTPVMGATGDTSGAGVISNIASSGFSLFGKGGTGKTATNSVSSIAAIASSSNPIGAALTGAGLLLNLFSSLNHPYGTCGPNSPDMDSFLACWKHPIPDNFIPWRESAEKGFNAFAYCPGAKAGRAPAAGCGGGCNCSGRGCVCAPTGAVKSLSDGSFLGTSGQSLGGITSSGIPTAPVSGRIAPQQPIQLGQVGTPVGQGVIVPYSAQTGQSVSATKTGGVPLQESSILPTNLSGGTLLIVALAAVATLAVAMTSQKHHRV
jgi:hypothetical protein